MLLAQTLEVFHAAQGEQPALDVIGERFTATAGFRHSNNPLPASTVTPLTAAIMQNGISAGVGYQVRRTRFDLSYGFDFTARETVGTSALVSGEYSNSAVRIGTQAIKLTTSFGL